MTEKPNLGTGIDVWIYATLAAVFLLYATYSLMAYLWISGTGYFLTGVAILATAIGTGIRDWIKRRLSLLTKSLLGIWLFTTLGLAILDLVT